MMPIDSAPGILGKGTAILVIATGLFVISEFHILASDPPKPITAPIADDRPTPTLRDGFEGDGPASFWLPGNYGSGLHVPDAIKITTSHARSGKHAVEITVHENDIAAHGDGDTWVERAELDSGHFPLLNKEAWYGFSFLIPKEFPIVNERLVISSCKQTDVPRPNLAERFRNGKHTLTIEAVGKKKEFSLPKIRLGEWMDMIFRVRYSGGQEGLVEVWANGKRVVQFSGPTAEPNGKNAFYHKIGLYRDRYKKPMTMYFDNYTMGTNMDAVDPSRFSETTR
jgi:Polysaccharide lyase